MKQIQVARTKKSEISVFESVSVGAGLIWRRLGLLIAKIAREDFSVPGVNSCSGDVWGGDKSSQSFCRKFFVIKIKRGTGACAHHIGQRLKIAHHSGAKGDVITHD